MKVTNKQLQGSVEAIAAISKLDTIPPENVQKFRRWLRKIIATLEDYAAAELAFRFSKAKKDADDQPVLDENGNVSAEDPVNFNRDFQEFLKGSVDLKVPMFDLAFLGPKAKLTIGQLTALDWLIKNPEDEDVGEEE